MIRQCKQCGSKQHTQDELHGKGNRVINVHMAGGKRVERCTVCGAQNVISESKEKSNGDHIAA